MASARPIRIATLYTAHELEDLACYDMANTRWLRISEGLARAGYEVDIIANVPVGPVEVAPRLRHVPYGSLDTGGDGTVDWKRYDVIKTVFHKGLTSLLEHGGGEHPFIISKLGSVVGAEDAAEGTYFFDEERAELFEAQCQIQARSRYVTILTEESRRLWEASHGKTDNVLIVPTGVDKEIPEPQRNPYSSFDENIAVYIGNFYSTAQREVNVLWQNRFNAIGRLLRPEGIRLCVVGGGSTDLLDESAVTYLGPVENERIWDYQYFADVGIVLAQGEVQHNESSKLYYYLRTGLPVVCEAPVPNSELIDQSGLGFVVEYANDDMMVERIETAARQDWDKKAAIRYVLDHHTWDHRVQIYDQLLKEELG